MGTQKVTPPKCCGKEATWVVQSATLQYWYCRTCKKEVGLSNATPSGIRNIKTDDEMIKYLEEFVAELDRNNGSMSNLIVMQATQEKKYVDPIRIATRQDLRQLEEEPCWRPGCRCHEE